MLLCGPPASGKTVCTQYLCNIGFATVSAGNIVRAIVARNGLPTVRDDLEEYGRRFINDEEEAERFAELILQGTGEERLIAIDGVRPRSVIRHIVERHPKAKIVYLNVQEEVLIARLLKRGGLTAGDAAKVLVTPLEVEAAGIKGLAHVVVENSGPLYRTLGAVHRIAERLVQGRLDERAVLEGKMF